MSNYILEAWAKENKKINKHEILTKNRLKTIEKREISLDYILQLEKENKELNSYINSFEMKEKESKNKILCNKINNNNVNNIYTLQIEEAINNIKNIINLIDNEENILKLKAIIIELKKDLYFTKNCFNPPILFNKIIFSKKNDINYSNLNGYKNINSTFYFHNINHISALIHYYPLLKSECYENLQSTLHWILIDFENLIKNSISNNLKDKYKDILIYKLNGFSNEEINNYLIKKYNKGYSLNYISSLINKVIPEILVNNYLNTTINWVYTYKLYGKWKKCSKCGQIKLANRMNFSLNKRGKYGLHSICKECRKR